MGFGMLLITSLNYASVKAFRDTRIPTQFAVLFPFLGVSIAVIATFILSAGSAAVQKREHLRGLLKQKGKERQCFGGKEGRELLKLAEAIFPTRLWVGFGSNNLFYTKKGTKGGYLQYTFDRSVDLLLMF